MTIYLDACCINSLLTIRTSLQFDRRLRPFEGILRRTMDHQVQWISSEALADEIARNPDADRRLENAACWACHRGVQLVD